MKYRDLRIACLVCSVYLILISAAAVGASTVDEGIAAYGSGDYKTAIEKWQILIKQGSPDGLFYLGVMYANGTGVARDTTRAFELYSEAAQKDHLSAQYNLGMQYATGEGVTQDFSKAEYWWTKAAERGLMQAQSNLGSLYYHGVAGQKNPIAARKWLSLAAQQGSPHAKEVLAKLDADEARTPGLASQFVAPDAPLRTATDTLRPAAMPAAMAPSVTQPAPAAAPAKVESNEYGPVKRGDTLRKIARNVNTEGVTLEQMLVSLYHANPDAFAGNMNVLKTGKILRIPETARVVETGQSEALKEIRIEAANWNAYRRKLADAAGDTTTPDARSAASGRVMTGVDEKAAAKEAQKDVLRLSKGEPTAGKGGSGKGASSRLSESVRMLEEEMVARENALAEANSRIAQLEKTVQDLQRLLEIKGQLPGVPAAKLGSQPAPEAKDTGKATADAQKSDLKAAPSVTGAPLSETPKAEPTRPGPPNVAPDVQAPPKPKAEPTTIIQAPPDLLDQVFAEPLYLAGGGLIALLGGAGYWLARRRRAPVADDEDSSKHAALKFDKEAAVSAAPVEPVLALRPHVTETGNGTGDDFALSQTPTRTNVKRDPLVPPADVIDFGLVAPAPGVEDTTAAGMTNTVDFQFPPEAPAATADGNRAVPLPSADVQPVAATTAVFPDFKSGLGDVAAPLAPEFKLDGINLDFDDTSKTGVAKAPGATANDRWNDIETKFDLARAYQEMGDKDAAREVLQQVVKRGNAGHQAEALKLLNSLG